jgi:acyl CoA:acetate/3-ketoacid CoA transferase alpha subunit
MSCVVLLIKPNLISLQIFAYLHFHVLEEEQQVKGGGLEVEQEQVSGDALQEEQQVGGGGLEEEQEQLGGGTLEEEQQVRGGGLEEDQEQLSGGALEDEVRGSGLRARCGSPGGADLLPWMRERERGRKK